MGGNPDLMCETCVLAFANRIHLLFFCAKTWSVCKHVICNSFIGVKVACSVFNAFVFSFPVNMHPLIAINALWII